MKDNKIERKEKFYRKKAKSKQKDSKRSELTEYEVIFGSMLNTLTRDKRTSLNEQKQAF